MINGFCERSFFFFLIAALAIGGAGAGELVNSEITTSADDVLKDGKDGKDTNRGIPPR